MKTTSFNCPSCGATLNVTVSANAATPACPSCTEKKTNSAQARLDALKAAGVDTSNLLAVHSASGEGFIFRTGNGGVPTPVQDNDPIFDCLMDKVAQDIKNGNYIIDRRLFRRWILSQVMHMLTERDWRTKKQIGFVESLHRKGYEYQFTMLKEELRVQTIIEKKDPECFGERNRWYNAEVAFRLCKEDIYNLKKYVSRLKTRHCKGEPYKRVHGMDIFCTDLNRKLYTPLEEIIGRIGAARTAHDLHYQFALYCRKRVSLPYNTKQCSAWVDAYKGTGAFFSLQNLVRFHGCVITDQNGITYDRDNSLKYLNRYAEQCKKGEGWRLFALLKKTMDDNHFDIEAKFKEWSEKKSRR